MDPADVIDRLGGVASLEQLRPRGIGRADVLAARKRGSVVHVRRGWYATRGSDERLVDAVRIRGQLTCISAAASMGLWVLEDAQLHVAVPGNGGRLNPRSDGAPPAIDDESLHLHWRDRTAAPACARQTLREVLRHVVECQPPHLALAVLDSAVRQRRASLAWVRRAIGDGARGRELAPLVTDRADAGGESILRYGLRRAGIAFETQARLPGLGPRDFKIGDRLIVEVDGREFHAQVDGFERDRRIDRAVQYQDCIILRFTYHEILYQWETVLSTILAFVREDRHRSRHR